MKFIWKKLRSLNRFRLRCCDSIGGDCWTNVFLILCRDVLVKGEYISLLIFYNWDFGDVGFWFLFGYSLYDFI